MDMNTGEEIIVLGVLAEASAKAWQRARMLAETSAPADEQGAAFATATILGRVHDRLQRSLYPSCEWLDNDACDRPVAGKSEGGLNYCKTHLARVQRQAVPA